MQVPPCTENLAANISCTLPEDVFAAWPQLNRVAFYVYDNTAVVASVTAGRKLQASVAAQAPTGVFLLSNYKVCAPSNKNLRLVTVPGVPYTPPILILD